MKKTIRWMILLLLFCMFGFGTTAEEAAVCDVVVKVQIDHPMMEVNGVQTEIDAGRGTTPVILGGRTLVPIRAVVEAFGGEVLWEQSTRTVSLCLEEDTVSLTIDSTTAVHNEKPMQLDTAPCVINGRTMLPLRFVAESFRLGMGWDGETRTVFVVRNGFDDAEQEAVLTEVPASCETPYVVINGNKPFFKPYEIIDASFAFYGDLDALGRCDVAFASVGADLAPTGERESIASVSPSGWINASYDFIGGKYLYNRCHLIGYQLTGENANERNLITGTRYLNIEGMLPFENQIDDYIEATENHVLYRVSPVFTGNDLVARGVLMEAYSVEDQGEGISFCVYCYNVQPYVTIDYATGQSAAGDIIPEDLTEEPNTDVDHIVYRTPTGKRYHVDKECGGENSYEVSLDTAKSVGLTPCKTCVQ